ncbi:MAG: aminoacyl-tRNA hydrolase [Calditrichia bacterium]
MYALIGLGNPGKNYEHTRHNVGFMVLDELANRHHGTFKKGKGSYVQTKVTLQGVPTLLIKPTTYMNLSGQAVRQVYDYYNLESCSRLLIVIDEFNLPFGTLRLKSSGSAGGQKGLKSILQTLHTNEVPRMRIGIGNEFANASSYVLSPFSKKEQKDLPLIIQTAADAAEYFVSKGIEDTMNTFNRNLLDN